MSDTEEIDKILEKNKEDWQGSNGDIKKARAKGRARVNNPKFHTINYESKTVYYCLKCEEKPYRTYSKEIGKWYCGQCNNILQEIIKK